MSPIWPSFPLSDVADIVSGLWTGKKGELVEARVLRNANFTKDSALDFSEVATISVEVKQFESRRLEKGDLILEKSGGGPKQAVGRVVEFDLNESGFSYSNFTARIRVKDQSRINSKFLQRYLWHFHMSGGTIPLQSNSTGIRNLSMPDYKNVAIPLPPLDEQKRIVAKLDEALGLTATLEKMVRREIASAIALLSAAIDIMLNTNLKEVQTRDLKSLAKKIGSGSTPRGGSDVYVDSGISFIRSLNVHDGKFRYENLAHIDNAASDKLSNVAVEQNDILINITGASIARTCIVPEGILPARVSQHVAIIRPDSNVVRAEYLGLLLRSPKSKKDLLGIGESAGTTRQALTKSSLEDFSVHFPVDKAEQEEIFKKYMDFESNLENYISIQHEKLKKIDSLQKQLLQSAFAGDF